MRIQVLVAEHFGCGLDKNRFVKIVQKRQTEIDAVDTDTSTHKEDGGQNETCRTDSFQFTSFHLVIMKKDIGSIDLRHHDLHAGPQSKTVHFRPIGHFYYQL